MSTDGKRQGMITTTGVGSEGTSLVSGTLFKTPLPPCPLQGSNSQRRTYFSVVGVPLYEKVRIERGKNDRLCVRSPDLFLWSKVDTLVRDRLGIGFDSQHLVFQSFMDLKGTHVVTRCLVEIWLIETRRTILFVTLAIKKLANYLSARQ